MPIFSHAEMARRVQNLRQRMAEQRLDCVIATSYAASYYLSGAPIHAFGRPQAVIIPLVGEPVLVQSIIEREHTEQQSWISDIRSYWDYNAQPSYADPQPPLTSLMQHIKTVINERKLAGGRIGIEDAHLPLLHYQRLQAALEQAQLVGVSDLLNRLRLVFSPEELTLVRQADAIADLGQQWLIDAIQPGVSAFDLTQTVRTGMIEELLRQHADKPFHLHVDCGLGAMGKVAGHSEWAIWNNDDRVAPGQLLTTGISVWLWGYWGNVERTVYVGELTPAVLQPFEVMVEANERAIAAIRPGVPLAEIDRITKEVLGQSGYGTRSGSGCGRGIVSYEGNARELAMDLRLYADVLLESGMAFSLEPDLQIPALGTFRHCNTIIVTEQGCEVDSRLPRGVIHRQ